MKKVCRFFNILTNAATWVVVLCAVFMIGSLYVPRFFGVHPYIVLSSSMEPSIHTGSLVYIGETEDVLGEGDILAYELDAMPVVHRVVDRTDEGYITKGDANDIPDMNPVKSSQVLGRYLFAVPGAGYILSEVRQHVFHAGPLAVPVMVPAVLGFLFLLYVLQYLTELLVKNES